MAYCSNCGNQLPDEGNVCSNCDAEYIINLQQLPQNVVIVQSTKKKIGYFDLWARTIIVAISYGLMSNNVCGSSLSPFYSECAYWKGFNWGFGAFGVIAIISGLVGKTE